MGMGKLYTYFSGIIIQMRQEMRTCFYKRVLTLVSYLSFSLSSFYYQEHDKPFAPWILKKKSWPDFASCEVKLIITWEEAQVPT